LYISVNYSVRNALKRRLHATDPECTPAVKSDNSIACSFPCQILRFASDVGYYAASYGYDQTRAPAGTACLAFPSSPKVTIE